MRTAQEKHGSRSWASQGTSKQMDLGKHQGPKHLLNRLGVSKSDLSTHIEVSQEAISGFWGVFCQQFHPNYFSSRKASQLALLGPTHWFSGLETELLISILGTSKAASMNHHFRHLLSTCEFGILLAAIGSFKPVSSEAFPLAWRENHILSPAIPQQPNASASFSWEVAVPDITATELQFALFVTCSEIILFSTLSQSVSQSQLQLQPSGRAWKPCWAHRTDFCGWQQRGVRGGREEKQISTAPLSYFPFSQSLLPFNRNTKENRKIIFTDSLMNARQRQAPCEGSLHYLWPSVLFAIPGWASFLVQRDAFNWQPRLTQIPLFSTEPGL